MVDKNKLVKSAFVIGALGDAVLQIANKTELGNTGLKSYFDNQSPIAAIIRASVLTGVSTVIYTSFFELNQGSYAVYAGLLDLLFRYYHRDLGFEDLEAYYEENSTAKTIIINMVVSQLVWIATKFIPL